MSKVAIVRCDSYDEFVVDIAIKRALDLLGGLEKFVHKGGKYLIKPNLCLPANPELALTTHPTIAKSIIKHCLKLGIKLDLADSPVGEASSKRMKQIWQETGYENLVKTIDFNKVIFNNCFIENTCVIKNEDYRYFMPKQIFEYDGIINLPKFKTHSLMTFTGSIKNLYGLLPASSKKAMHCNLPNSNHFAELLLDIYGRIRPALNIVDAVMGLEGEGPGRKGKPRLVGLLIVGTDAVAVDIVCGTIINLSSSQIPVNKVAISKFNAPKNYNEIEIVGEEISKVMIKDFELPIKTTLDNNIVKKFFKLSKEKIWIKSSDCKKCGLCEKVCPVSAISIGEQTNIDEKKCIACCSCLEICPCGAVNIKKSDFYNQIKDMRRI